jgi:hypothetical protein
MLTELKKKLQHPCYVILVNITPMSIVVAVLSTIILVELDKISSLMSVKNKTFSALNCALGK